MPSVLAFNARVCALSPACNGFLRFTSGATPADLLVVSMTAEPFLSTHWHTSISGARVCDRACQCLTACDKTDALSK